VLPPESAWLKGADNKAEAAARTILESRGARRLPPKPRLGAGLRRADPRRTATQSPASLLASRILDSHRLQERLQLLQRPVVPGQQRTEWLLKIV